MTTEKVSVVIPVHGELAFLDMSLESIANQVDSDFNLECIVVFDRVPEAAQESIKLKYSSVYWRYFESTDSGIVAALNLGVSHARGTLIARLDADDLMSAERIEKQAACFEANQDLVLLGSQVLEIDIHDNPLRLRHYPETKEEIIKFSHFGSPFAHPAVMFRKETFLEVGGYREFYSLAEDYDLFLRLLERGDVKNLPSVLTQYRVHSGQISVQRKKDQLIAEAASKEAGRSRLRGTSEPSDDYLTLVTWWNSFGLTQRGSLIKTALGARIKFYTTESRIVRLLLFSFLLILHPKQYTAILVNRFSSPKLE